MSRVIAAVDNSLAARAVLEAAKTIGSLLDATVEALHVVEDGSSAAEAAAAAVGLALRPVAGSPAEQLTAACAADDVAAVVIASRSATLAHGRLGSVAARLITAIDKPLIVVPPEAHFPATLGRVLVPLDGTEETTEALRRTIHLACRPGVHVVALHVHGADSLPLFEDQTQHEHECWVEEFLARYCPCPGDVELEIRVGAPGEQVVRVAEEIEADLIMLGWCRNLSPGHAAVVRETLERGSTPVLLVPVEPGRGRAEATLELSHSASS